MADINKTYLLKDTLGKGTFASVKRGVRKADGAEFAIKVIKTQGQTPEELAVVHDEIVVMRKIDHPNCVKLFDVFEDKKRVYLVLELLQGGELFDSIVAKGNYSEADAAATTKAINDAIMYLHGQGIAHRDLKPENLLYERKGSQGVGTGLLKVTDFGLAKIGTKGTPIRMHTACGTPGYVAPEVLKMEEYGLAVDVWSMGVILYILLCGFPPFYHEDTAQLYKLIKKGEYDFPEEYWGNISEEAKGLVRAMLTVDPKRRITCAEIAKSTWLNGAASERAFGAAHHARLQTLQARAQFRRGVKKIITVNRFASALKRLSAKQQTAQ